MNLGSIFTDPKAYADPPTWHATAKQIRDTQPILRVDDPAFPVFHAITKHADVMEVERHPEVFFNTTVPAIAPGREDPPLPPVKTLVQMDGDEHKAHRNIVNDWFKPANVRSMQERINELAVFYVDQMEAKGTECDFLNDIALHFPLRVILSILGLPESDYPRMLRMTQELFGGDDPDFARAGEDENILTALLDMVNYFTELTGARRLEPTADLASVIANARLDGEPLPDMDTMGHYVIIATAGHDTTSSSIAGGLLAMIEHPGEWERLKADPSLVDGAADEIVRYTSPVKHFMRTAQSEYTVRDTTFRPGDKLLLSYASANRDDEVFADPMRFDVGRDNASAHLAFGFGHHFCLGAHLARLEIRAIFHELVRRVDSFELAGTPTWVQSTFVQGPKSIPIRYKFN